MEIQKIILFRLTRAVIFTNVFLLIQYQFQGNVE